MSAVCQHRAMQVCEGRATTPPSSAPTTTGSTGWTAACSVRRPMERTEDFDKSDMGAARRGGRGVARVHLRELRPRPRAAGSDSFERYDAVPRQLRPRRTRSAPGTFTLEDMPWNWKVMFENFNDGYHANRLHQYVQDFCPSINSAFSRTLVRRLQRDLPHQPATPTWTAASTPPTASSCRCFRT